MARFELLWTTFFGRGINPILTEQERLVQTFIHSGYIERVATEDGGEAIHLGLLKTPPLLTTLVAVPITASRRFQTRTELCRLITSPVGQTDFVIAAYAVVVTLAYIQRLPIHAMVTVRYLLPILPCLVYAVVRLTQVRHVLHTRVRIGLVSYAGTVLVGGQLLLIVLLVQQTSLGEAVQFHAWIGLGAATIVGVWALITSIGTDSYDRIGAVSLGIATGATTMFLLPFWAVLLRLRGGLRPPGHPTVEQPTPGDIISRAEVIPIP